MQLTNTLIDLLKKRGISGEEEIAEFLSPKPRRTYPPSLLADADAGVDFILQEIEKGSRICIYGDYDADGITSTSLMLQVLRHLMPQERLGYYIPSRFEEGYGLNRDALRQIAERGYQAVITVDCGSVSAEEVRYAKELGLSILVTDHHTITDRMADCLLVNPKRADSAYPFRELCGCGVAFKMAQLLQKPEVTSALVFTRTKHGANKVASDLVKSGITAAAIHGNKSQTARQQALADFKAGKVQCLVATDIAARGIDIEELSHVFNYNLPEVPETYVHRIGRTGRAGHGGTAISFCDFAEREYRKGIEKLIGKKLPVVEGHPWPMEVFEAPRDAKGRTVNADDAEARAAARERKALRDTAQKRAQPAPAPEAAAPMPARKKRKPNWQKAEGERAGRLDAVLPERSAGPVEADYGDFNRPDPLGEDRIMDATARLLAPRPRMFSQRPEAPAPEKRARKKKKSAAGPAAEPRERPAQGGRAKRREEGKSAVPAPVQAGKKRHDRGRGHRAGPVMPTWSSSVKDSTEQPSLMKPYYLNDD